MLESCAASAGDSRPALSSRRNSFGGARSNFVDVPLPLEPLAPLQPLDGWHASPPMPGQIKVRRGAGFNRQAQLVASGDAKGYQQPSTSHAITTTIWSFVVTLAFGLGVVYPMKGRGGTMDFFTGFLVEKSLSVDNLFVFLMLFEYFKVPEAYQQRVLKWGIISALVLRGFMIALGIGVIQRFRPMLLLFAGFSSSPPGRCSRARPAAPPPRRRRALLPRSPALPLAQPEDDMDMADNPVMKIARKLVDATDTYDGDKFFTTIQGVRKATPMLVVLICIELSDVVFAIDSIPAVVGITQDPFIVYTSNAFALLALRSLYVLLSKSVQHLHYLRHAVALILGFVGVKMTLEFFHMHLSSGASLSVIAACLTGGVVASLQRNRRLAKAQTSPRSSAGADAGPAFAGAHV